MDVPSYIDDVALDGLRAGHGASMEALIAYLDWRNRVRYSPAEVYEQAGTPLRTHRRV